MKLTAGDPANGSLGTWTWVALCVGCLVINLGTIAKAGLVNLQVTTLLFSLGIAWRLHQRGIPRPLLARDRVSRWVGALLLVLMVVISLLPAAEVGVRVLPLLSALGLATLAVGIKNLKHYRQELLLFLVLAAPLEQWVAPIDAWVNVSTHMAQLAHFLLWYVGFNVARQGDIILLPAGSTWVGANCAGTLTILWMLQLSILVLTLFPMPWPKRLLIPTAAVAIVAGCNSIRIAILTLLAAHNPDAFAYWHSSQSQSLSTIPILLFAWFCRGLLTPKPSSRQASHDVDWINHS